MRLWYLTLASPPHTHTLMDLTLQPPPIHTLMDLTLPPPPRELAQRCQEYRDSAGVDRLLTGPSRASQNFTNIMSGFTHRVLHIDDTSGHIIVLCKVGGVCGGGRGEASHTVCCTLMTRPATSLCCAR